jgi:hypothetical protein
MAHAKTAKTRRARKEEIAFAVFVSLCGLCVSLYLFSPGSKAQAQRSPSEISFERDVAPILHDNCIACHSSQLKSGGLQIETYQDLMKGGASGAVVLAGRSNESKLALMLEGRAQPRMPMGGALKPAEIELIKAWIDAGARNSAPGPLTHAAATADPLSVPDIKPKVSLLAQVSSLAFRPDGRALAVAGYKQVEIIDPARGEVTARLTGAAEVVRSLAYSRDGKWLAAAGGEPGRFGEVMMWDGATGKLAYTLRGHRDYIYQADFSPDGKLIATSSYDKTVKLWDVASGREVATLKDHTDAVFPVRFSPDGKLLASGAADRTVKLWDVATARRLFTLSDSLDSVLALSFHPSGKLISAAGADRIIRTWELAPEGGVLVRSVIAHEDAIIGLAYSPDGKFLASTSADRMIKIWDGATGAEVRAMEKQPDWAGALAFSPDGARLAVGRYDGSVSIYEVAGGRKILDPIK